MSKIKRQIFQNEGSINKSQADFVKQVQNLFC